MLQSANKIKSQGDQKAILSDCQVLFHSYIFVARQVVTKELLILGGVEGTNFQIGSNVI